MLKKVAKIVSVLSALLQLFPIWWQLIFFFIAFTFGEVIAMMDLGDFFKNFLRLLVVVIPFAVLVYCAFRSIKISFFEKNVKDWQYKFVITLNLLIIFAVLRFIATMGLMLKFP
jgi:hypothetical protein